MSDALTTEAPVIGGPPVLASARPTNVLAIVALVLTFLCAPAGLICGLVARAQIKKTGEQGDGLALGAVITSTIFIVIWIIAVALFVSTATVFVHCLTSAPPVPAGTGLHWVCTGNNVWIANP